VPGRKEASVLTVRMRSANPLARMPPLGVQVIDDAGLALVERWIRNDLHQP
jgi:mono/diheme cytochrome c family protein